MCVGLEIVEPAKLLEIKLPGQAQAGKRPADVYHGDLVTGRRRGGGDTSRLRPLLLEIIAPDLDDIFQATMFAVSKTAYGSEVA